MEVGDLAGIKKVKNIPLHRPRNGPGGEKN